MRDPAAPIDHVPGDATGLALPAHPAALEAAGAAWLTQAFRAFGALDPAGEVAQIARIAACPGGSTGQKLFLDVVYRGADPTLPTALFVKFSRDFTDPRRDDPGRWEMESEARFAAVAARPGFPIAVPRPLFADYHHASGTGIIVTERVGFGTGAIEPHRRKCLDHLHTPDPLPYYRTIVVALARLAGAHKAGRLGADIDALFPFDRERFGGDPILATADQLAATVAAARNFTFAHPRLVPDDLRDAAFWDRVARDAQRIRTHEPAIRAFLVSDPDFIALCHWNAHIDNAWFERDPEGTLRCGLIDWGRVGQITLGAVLWGALSAAPHVIWDEHLDALLACFTAEYHAGGGPRIAPDALEQHLLLHIAEIGVARVLAFPEVVLFRLPQAAGATGPRDPLFETCDPARNSLHILTVFLNLWRRRDFGRALDLLTG
jgi:hypothetical protein